ncbi:helix-turn-helix domain-containing protein, partial [Ruminococcaceae bacterium OttesenSCG-928-L11]|nr:helix-turn-helix domain-containing protein [Ruminococcaceae bacterium OttesenSCG-928-L11]
MKRQMRDKATFYRYLFSYLLIFLIPFLLSFFIFNFYFVSSYKKDTVLNHSIRSAQTGRTLDWQISQIQNLTTQIRLSDQFNPGAAEDKSHQLSMMRQLHMLRSSNELIYNIHFYQKNLDTIISTRTIVQKETVEQFHYRYPAWPREQLMTEMEQLIGEQWRPFEPVVLNGRETQNLLSYLVPLRDSGAYNSQSLLIQIEEGAFRRLLGLDVDSGEIFVILTGQGEVFFASRPLPETIIDALEELPLASLDRQTALETDGYLLCGSRSEETSWYYLTLLPTELVMKEIRGFQLIYLVYTGGVLVLCLFIIAIMSRRNYRPIKELHDMISGSPIPVGRGMDEIDTAKMAIAYLNDFSYGLEQRLEESAHHVRDSLLRELLQGKFETVAAFNDHAKAHGVSFHSAYLLVAVLAGAGRETPGLSQIVSEKLSVHFEVKSTTAIGSLNHVFLCGTDDDNPEELQAAFLETVQEIAETCNVSVCFGVSRPTSEVSTLYSRYIEAVSAAEYIQATTGRPVVVYGQGPSAQSAIHYPTEEIDTMRQYAHAHDAGQFTRSYETLRRYVDNLDVAIFIRTCVCFDVINALIKILLDTGDNAVAGSYLTQRSVQSVGRSSDVLWHIQTMEQLYEKVLQTLNNGAPKSDETLERIRSYIDDHYLERDFSVQSLADAFSMSLTNISSYFKSHTGTTLIQYITARKMNYALGLLKHTDMPLTEIATETGYASGSSFIRKFKQYTGTTP